jgi:hypothetical protein
MIQINKKSTVKSLTFTLHEQMKANNKMKVSEFREIFSKTLGAKDWNALLGQFDNEYSPLLLNNQSTFASISRQALDTGYPNIDNSLDLHQPNDEYDKAIHGVLIPSHAIALIELFYSSEFWFLAPFMGGVFNTKEQALNFVENNHDYPLSVVMSTNNSQGSVSTLVNSYKGRFYFHDEDQHSILYWSDDIQSLKINVADFMTGRAKFEHNENSSYVIPFIPKGHELKDYVNNFDYDSNEHGELTVSHAKELIDFCETHKQYSLGRLDGQPFRDKEEAEEFISYFPTHSLILIADLGYFNEDKDSLGCAIDVFSQVGGKEIFIQNRDEMSVECIKNANNIYALEEKNLIKQFLLETNEIS